MERGVFETLLVHDGRPVELGAHLERLAASLRTLYGMPLPAEGAARAVDAARGLALGRLRLTAAPEGPDNLSLNTSAAEVEAEAVFPSWEHGADLLSVAVDGGLGPHKWVDRRVLNDAEAARPETLPLLIGADGAVLEAGRANLFVVCDGALITPPNDGRILPGIARMRTLELAREAGIEAREERLSLEDLRNADEVFLTGSVRGIEPACSLDGDPLPRSGETTDRLARALRRLWLSGPS